MINVQWLKLSEKNGITSLDEPSVTILHATILKQKLILRKLYEDFYREFRRSIDISLNGLYIEIGSGGGFLKKIIPAVITSDLLFLPDIDVCLSAQRMPIKNETVDAFLLLNVLHHVKQPSLLFEEFNRCLKHGGKIVMIEPANTLWGRFVYKNFHHEAYDPFAGWTIKGAGPLSSANGALPWIIFFRDRDRFEKDFPHLKIQKIKFHTPLCYIVSGGFSIRQLLPSFMYNIIKGVEYITKPLNKCCGMFMTVEVKKT